MAQEQYKIYALIPVVVAGLYFLLHCWRFGKFAYIPSPYKRSLLLGHLGFIGAELKKLGNSKIHSGQSLHTFP